MKINGVTVNKPFNEKLDALYKAAKDVDSILMALGDCEKARLDSEQLHEKLTGELKEANIRYARALLAAGLRSL